jgi:hypothetical protein
MRGGVSSYSTDIGSQWDRNGSNQFTRLASFQKSKATISAVGTLSR